MGFLDFYLVRRNGNSHSVRIPLLIFVRDESDVNRPSSNSMCPERRHSVEQTGIIRIIRYISCRLYWASSNGLFDKSPQLANCGKIRTKSRMIKAHPNTNHEAICSSRTPRSLLLDEVSYLMTKVSAFTSPEVKTALIKQIPVGRSAVLIFCVRFSL